MISERTDNLKNGYLNSFLNGNQILVYLFCLYTSRRRYKLQMLAAKLTNHKRCGLWPHVSLDIWKDILSEEEFSKEKI